MHNLAYSPIARRDEVRRGGVPVPGSRGARHDVRWPAIVAALAALRRQGRRAVRIVDIDCGAGSLLLNALHHARALGFTAIEGRGIDGSPALIGRAAIAAERARDHAIGVVFEVADMMTGLEEETELPADILLWHGSRVRDRVPAIADLRRAAHLVIGDDGVIGPLA